MIDFFKEEEYEGGYSTEDKVVLGSVGTGALLVILGILSYITVSTQIGGALLLLGIIVGILPYGIISFLKNRAVREMEDQFPSFLRDLAESKRGGMTILQAFESAKDSDYGRLNNEIEKIHDQLTWGVPFPKVMERFSRRMESSAVIQESVSILLESFRSGGDITKTIEAISEDAAGLKETIQKKNSKIKQQVFIMYIIYFFFVGITIGIYVMLAKLLGLGTAGGGALEGLDFLSQGGGGGGGVSNYCSGKIAAAQPLCESARLFGFVPSNVTSFTSDYATTYSYGNMAYYKSLLFSMLMVQGASTAAVAGQIGEGSPSAGVKHALIMLPISFIVYMYMVGLAGV